MGIAILTAVVVDDAALTLEELAQACAVEPDWVVARVRTGILLDDSHQRGGDIRSDTSGDNSGDISGQNSGDVGGHNSLDNSASWRFSSADLVRARRLCQIERAFDANDDVAALVVDLSEEIRRLRAKLNAAGVK